MPVIFDSNRRQLINGDSVTGLSPQQTDCLLLLISAQGVAVPRQAIMQKCWTDKGLIVSGASVRVALYQLRKQLAAAGIPAGALVTETGRGYRLRTGFIVHDSTGLADRVSPSSYELPSEQALPSAREPEDTFKPLWTPWVGKAVILFLLLFSGLLAGYFRLSSFATPVRYVSVFQQDDMNILVQQGMHADADWVREHYLSVADMVPERFRIPWIYVNRSLNHDALSALVCDRNITEAGKTCFSLRWEKEI